MANKKGFEFSFGWLFALIIGAAILFLAIYGVVRLITSEREVLGAEVAKQLGILLIPAETGYGEGKTIPPIKFATETRIYNNCSVKKGVFGEQEISVSTSSNIGAKWTKPGVGITYQNKYIFSNYVIEGRELNVFSKTFSFPYKVGELLFAWSDKDYYCLINPPTEIENELSGLGIKNINYTDTITNCNKESRKICFYSSLPDCDVVVDTTSQKIMWKGGRISNYDGALIYGAIFSNEIIYECQVQRLMKRTAELAYVYLEKSKSLSARAGGCSQELQDDLIDYAKKVVATNSSYALRESSFMKEELKMKNSDMEVCKLW